MNTKAIIVFASMVWLMFGSTIAKPVGVDLAHQVAQGFISHNHLQIKIPANGRLTEVGEANGWSRFYVFCGEDNRGFVIVSADDCVIPILGYSEDSPVEMKALPPQVQWWLEGYEEEIEQHVELNHSGAEVEGEWSRWLNPEDTKAGQPLTTIGPLITTKWDQSPYYNALFPTQRTGSSKTLAGCVATAGAQLLKYWNHPTTGRGSESYAPTATYLRSAVTLTADFGNTQYDWDNMPNRVMGSSTQVQKDAVAQLVYHVAVAVHMQFSSSASSAHTCSDYAESNYSLESALVKYFRFQNTITHIEKNDMTDYEWKNAIRHEIECLRPILYTGRTPDGSSGHSFICDGYDSQLRFHFNWGWSGSLDGYFEIGYLNPSPMPSLNRECQAVVGAQPSDLNVDETGSTTITVASAQPDRGYATGSGVYANFSTNKVKLLAIANEGYRFDHWSDGSTLNPRQFTATGGNQTYYAYFRPVTGAEQGYCATKPWGALTSAPQAYGIKLAANCWDNADALQGVQLMVRDTGLYTIKVYAGLRPDLANANATDMALTSTLLRTATTRVTSSSQYNLWISIPLSTPLLRSSLPTALPLWIVVEHVNRNGNFSIPLSRYGGSTNGSWRKVSNAWNTYANNSNPGYCVEWMIKGMFAAVTPYAVSSVTVEDVGDNHATVSWTMADSNAARVHHYNVAYGTCPQPDNLPVVVVDNSADAEAQANSVALDNLLAQTNYYIYVQAAYGPEGQVVSDWRMVEVFTQTPRHYTDPVVLNLATNSAEMGCVVGEGTYERGSSVLIQALPLVGYAFGGWSDGDTHAVRTITLAANSTLGATFAPIGLRVTVGSSVPALGTAKVEGDEGWTLGGQQYFPFMATALFTATPVAGCQFVEWSDGNTNNPRYMTVVDDISLTAIFQPKDTKQNYHITTCNNAISILSAETQPVRVFDMLGRCVYRGTCRSSSPLVVSVAQGIYLVKVGGHNAEKIMIY